MTTTSGAAVTCHTTTRTCRAEVCLPVLSREILDAHAVVMRTWPDLNIASARDLVTRIRDELEAERTIAGECPFEGLVDVYTDRDVELWTCPTCSTEHQADRP